METGRLIMRIFEDISKFVDETKKREKWSDLFKEMRMGDSAITKNLKDAKSLANFINYYSYKACIRQIENGKYLVWKL